MRHAPWSVLTSLVLVLSVAFSGRVVGQSAGRLTEDESAVMKVDEAYRLAKLRNDVRSLDQILAGTFWETNQNGNTRDKVATLELWRTFRIASLTTNRFDVRVAGNSAVVSGHQTEHNQSGVDQIRFTRMYERTAGTWRIVASAQFHEE